MLSISEAAKRSGISAYTLRYYEKIGLLPSPERMNGGKRYYTDADIQFILFLKSLKETGMALEDIHEFVKDGCIWDKVHSDKSFQVRPSVSKRMEILSKHLGRMEEIKRELENVMNLTKEKLAIYHEILQKEKREDSKK